MNRKERGQTEKLVARLVDDELLELVEDGDTGTVIDAVGARLVEWTDDRHHGAALGDLLAAHPQVAEVFASDDELQEQIERWRRAVRGVEVVVTDARNAEIEAKLAAERDDELAAVYADWLIEHGNPLGELFACATDAKARKSVLAKHGAVLWGRLAEYAKLFDCTWDRTGVAAIAIERSTAFELEWGRVISAVLELPLAMFCRAVTIGTLPPSASSQLDDLLDVIAARPHPSVHRVVATTENTYRPVELGRLASGFANLRSFELSASYLKQPLVHPTLAHLRLRLEGRAALENALTRAELPGLRRLALATRYAHPGPDVLGTLVDAPWFSSLEELDVQGLHRAPTAIARQYGDRLSHLRLV